jgi:hypothetical protein
MGLRSGFRLPNPGAWASQWLASMREGARTNGAMAARAASSALVACLLGVPPELRRGAAADARAAADALCLASIYGGDRARMDADFGFYADGFLLLQRDLARDGPLLFVPGPLTQRCAFRLLLSLLSRSSAVRCFSRSVAAVGC